ncbi:MAG: hypothetical protein A2133_07205 [Actinobacteria bacterium RBG_16_64_13]|nr:MAG: hypothetical protein A2133_07205 [Actinobacteria bacterium RBG_16_64_13]
MLFVGALSFPLFLVHYPLLRVVRYLDDYGVDRPTAIGCFLVFALLMSWIVLVIDRRIPRARILGGRREQRHRITGHPHTKTR